MHVSRYFTGGKNGQMTTHVYLDEGDNWDNKEVTGESVVKRSKNKKTSKRDPNLSFGTVPDEKTNDTSAATASSAAASTERSSNQYSEPVWDESYQCWRRFKYSTNNWVYSN
jgi:hypothetical protein